MFRSEQICVKMKFVLVFLTVILIEIISAAVPADTPGFFLKVAKNVPRVSRASFHKTIWWISRKSFFYNLFVFQVGQAKQLFNKARRKECSAAGTSKWLQPRHRRRSSFLQSHSTLRLEIHPRFPFGSNFHRWRRFKVHFLERFW